jgi:hypothetical protein
VTEQLPVALIKLAALTYWHGQGTGSAEVRVVCPDRSEVIAASNATDIDLAAGAELARCEINAPRYRVLHVATRITHGARQLRLRLDNTWRWATAIATAWHRLLAAFP